MTAAEEGLLLLCCRLGDSGSKPLTMAQFRDLGSRVRAAEPDRDLFSDLSRRDLERLGCPEERIDQVLCLLSRQSRLQDYLSAAAHRQITAVTRISPAYPRRVIRNKQLSSPPVLFAMGDLSLLERPSVAVVGSRKLLPENAAFARAAGRKAAEEQLVLVSGNANGADRTAQDACLNAGGSCVVFVADRLTDHTPHDRILYISEDGYELPFSPARALHRNALIHMQGDRTLAVQCTHGKGGTWEGCRENLRHGWSDLFVYDDGSPGMKALMEQGAIGIRQLPSISGLRPEQISFL